MEEEKTAVEELQEFAKRTNREIDIVEQEYPHEFRVPGPRYKRAVYIPNDSNNKVFFAAFSDFKAAIDNAMFSGVFFEIRAPKESFFSVRKKNILDKINLFSGRGGFMASHDFTKKVVINENDDVVAAKVLFNTRVQHAIIEALNLDLRLTAGLNDVDLGLVKKVEGESHFGIILKTQWLSDPKVIDRLFSIVEKMRLEINN